MVVAALLVVGSGMSRARAVEPVLYEGFEAGKIEGFKGKAGPRFTADPRGLINMERGTIAFFYSSGDGPKESEWGGPGGLSTTRDAGYWSMALRFSFRKQTAHFDLFDVSGYAPPLQFESPFGRWKANEWHHLAAVWDRNEGMTIYEDGKKVNSNWGKYHWQWSLLPERFSLGGPLDELYIYDECLTDAQIAQLAKGEAATGAPIAITPAAQRRDKELARMGWVGESLSAMPRVASGGNVGLTFARIAGAVDAKRPVAYTWEGLLRSMWPSGKYGTSIRGQRLEMTLDPGQSYDHMRIFSHRDFVGRLVHTVDCRETPVIDIDIPHAMFWNARLPAALSDSSLVLERDFGQIGHVDFYRVDKTPAAPTKVKAYTFAKAEAFPSNYTGKLLISEYPRHQHNPVTLTAGKAEAWTLKTDAFEPFQAIAEAPAEATAFDGAVVELSVEGLSGATPVRVEVREPVDAERVWLAADVVLEPKGAGRQTYAITLKGRPVINQPPMKTRKYLKDGKYSDTDVIDVPGVGCVVVVTAGGDATWHMGDGGSAVKLIVAEMNAATVARAADDQEEFMREAYAERMEGHGYSESRLITPLVWLAHFAPDRMKFRQMWERVDASKPSIVGLDIPPLKMPEIANNTGAPDWAFWQMQAVDRIRKHVHWIIDHKQVWTGEYGGIWNDDSTHVENWMGYMLSIDGEGKIKDSMHRYWTGLWNYQLTQGVGKYTQDAGHYSEEGSSNLGMRLLIDYGDPVAYARTLLAASHTEKWVAPDPNGDGLVWKGWWVGPYGAWTEGAFLQMKKQLSHQQDIIVPLGYLSWYNRHPKAIEYYVGLSVSGVGFHGMARHAATDWEAQRQRLAEILKQPTKGDPQGYGHILAINEFGVSEEIKKIHGKPFSVPGPIMHYWGSKNTDQHWFDWRISGDDRWLVESYKRVCEWFYSHDWLNGPAQPSMDRNPLPRGSVIRSRIGALAANRGSSGVMWPQHAISFTKGGDHVASLVTENLPNQFTVKFYPFTDKPLDLQLRTWRCNGTFNVKLMTDRNDDGVGEEVISEKQMQLDRGAYMDLTLPAKQGAVLAVTPVKVEPENFDRADPAISAESIELVYGAHLMVKVYNNGTKPVKDVLVRVRDIRTGEIVINGDVRTGPIEAPLDFQPRYKAAEFKNLEASTWGGFTVEIDPDHEIDDLTRHNNFVRIRYSGTFIREKGYQ